MKICIAQIRPIKGAIAENILKHLAFIKMAIETKADVIFFPELSITGYEPTLANELALTIGDERLDVFQQLSNSSNVCMAIGAPLKTKTGIQIGMLYFQPSKPIEIYSKQQLHSDEYPFFEPGNTQALWSFGDVKIAPAICFESLQHDHVENATKLGATVYLASVAKSQKGIAKALAYYPTIASAYKIHTLMCNIVGMCDDFMSAGQSSIWNTKGELMGQLDHQSEGILTIDMKSDNVEKIVFN